MARALLTVASCRVPFIYIYNGGYWTRVGDAEAILKGEIQPHSIICERPKSAVPADRESKHSYFNRLHEIFKMRLFGLYVQTKGFFYYPKRPLQTCPKPRMHFYD